jgi:hypothetical protein
MLRQHDFQIASCVSETKSVRSSMNSMSRGLPSPSATWRNVAPCVDARNAPRALFGDEDFTRGDSTTVVGSSKSLAHTATRPAGVSSNKCVLGFIGHEQAAVAITATQR